MSNNTMNKQNRWDFADHVAHNTFGPKLEAIFEKLQGKGEVLMECLATKDMRKKAAALPENMTARTKEIVIELEYGYFNNPLRSYKCRSKDSVTITLPEKTPLLIHSQSYTPYWHVISYDITQVERQLKDDGEIYWIPQHGVSTFRSELLPLIRESIKMGYQQSLFRSELFEKLMGIRTLKSLKASAPELHDMWVEYFGESATNLPAVRFDDILQTMKKVKAA